MEKYIRLGTRDRIFLTIVYLGVILLSIAILYPLWFVVIASISDPDMVASGKVLLLPKGIMFEGYNYIFRDKRIWQGFYNTACYTVFGTILALFLTVPSAYALSRKDMLGRNIIMRAVLITKYFSGGLIPTYLVVKGMNLVNTPYVLIVLGSFSVFNHSLPYVFYKYYADGAAGGCGDRRLRRVSVFYKCYTSAFKGNNSDNDALLCGVILELVF